MKINQVVEDVERGSVTQERGFSIQANARAFQILSSNLYADKITAVIRELSCNALDSHVAAGKTDTPFDVHLPTILEPYFSVQDYGLGLSHDQVMSIYTTYFESTKTNTNELIGGLGLGSKSPFSYTNSFDVTSVHDGVTRNYAMFINEAGKPSVAFMGDSPTQAPNGVKVSIPVKSADFAAFQDKSCQVLQWFSHQPVVSGLGQKEIPKIATNPDLQGTGWRLRNVNYERSYYSRGVAVALMGNVAYPITSKVIDDKFHSLLSWPLIIDFGIGELDISASREELSYDDVTVQIIQTRLNQILEELKQRIQVKFDKADTMWQARLMHLELYSDRTVSDILYVLKHAGFLPTWQGKQIAHDWITWNKIFDGIDPKNPTVNPDPAPGVYDVSTYSRARRTPNVTPSTKAVFILKDVSDASARCRMRYYQGKHTAYLIEGVLDTNASKCPQVAKLLKYLGDPPIILASSLDKAPRKGMKFKGIHWTGHQYSWHRRKSDSWSAEEELNTDQGGYYVTISGLDPVYILADKKVQPVRLNDIVKCARELAIIGKDDKIWGINKTNSRLIKDQPKWVNIYEFVQNKVHELISDGSTANMVQIQQQYMAISNKFHSGHETWANMFGKHDNSLGKFVNAWKNAHRSSNKVNSEALRTLANLYSTDLDVHTVNKTPDLLEMWNQAVKDYPMLVKFERETKDHVYWPLLIDYVNFVDTTKK